MANTKLTIDRGCTYTINYVYMRNGVAATLVGATVRFTIKSAEYSDDTDDSDATLVKNITNGTASGTATITIDPSDTATLTPGTYYYDIKVDVNSDGTEVYKTDEGKIKLDASPTNRLS